MARRIRIGHDHAWIGRPTLSFAGGLPTTAALASVIYNPKNVPLVYALSSGTLPSGATLSGSTVTWTTNGAVGTYPLRFTATYGARVVISDALLLQYLNVEWTPATQDVDGSPIETIVSHKIYAGQTSGVYTSTLTVPWLGVPNAQIALPTSGIWFVSVTTVTTAGESLASAEQSRLANTA